MKLSGRMDKIKYLGDAEKDILSLELDRVIPSFGSNLVEACVHGSAVMGYSHPGTLEVSYMGFPKGFIKKPDGWKSHEVDVLMIVKELPLIDPISGQLIYMPLEEVVLENWPCPWRPNPADSPRILYSRPSAEGDRLREEGYRHVEIFELPEEKFYIDWNVASERQYRYWEDKVPGLAKIVLYENPSK